MENPAHAQKPCIWIPCIKDKGVENPATTQKPCIKTPCIWRDPVGVCELHYSNSQNSVNIYAFTSTHPTASHMDIPVGGWHGDSAQEEAPPLVRDGM